MANQYWQGRIQLEIKNKLESDVEINKALSSLHKRHLQVIEKEIESFYQKYANKTGMDISEAKKRASLFDVQAFAEKAAEYVRTKDFSPEANEKLALYNMKMRVNRLELLQYNLELEMVSLGNEEFKMTQKFLNQEFIQEINAQAGILGEFVPDVKMIHQMADGIINVPFHGAMWSDNIWKRQDLLRGYVGNLVNTAIIQGKNSTNFIPELRKMFDASAHEAKRLAVTETARVQSAVQKSMMEVNDFKQYEYITEPTACKHCAALNGKIFDVKDMKPGENCAPIHPFCRCSTAPYIERGRNNLTSENNEDNTTTTRLNRNRNLAKRKTVNIVRQNKLTSDFRKRGGIVWQGDDADQYLKSRGAQAANLDSETIILQSKATISEILEELYHAEQWKDGRLKDDTVSKIKAEIEAQYYLLSVSKRYNIPKEEIDETKRNLEFWKKELGKYEDN